MFEQFDQEFYPTPKEVIMKMVEPYLIKIEVSGWMSRHPYFKDQLKNELSVYDPSAGSGAILDYVQEISGNNTDIYCSEQDPILIETLRGKGYNLVSDDFFKYEGDLYFDLILMNPPFSNADKHLEHAWNILKSGDIVCLMNEETIKNPFSTRRKFIAKLIEDHGSVEFLGDCFASADRKTGVNIAMVRLKKESTYSEFHFDFKSVTNEKGFHIDESTLNNSIAVSDVIGNMMLQFERLKEAYIKYLKAKDELNFYSSNITGDSFDILKVANDSICDTRSKGFNRFSTKIRREMWKKVINQSNLQKYMTHDIRENFDNFIKSQGSMDFTKENVANLIEFLFENRFTILERAIGEVFEIFTKYHDENRHFVEGWKTNDKYKVNKKVILPNGVRYGKYMTTDNIKTYGDTFNVNYGKQSEYSDIDKAMCYISGHDYNTITTIYKAMDSHFSKIGKVKSGTFDNVCHSQFFDIKFFKKGTIHLTFKNEKLWEQFNLRACAGKNWLPEAEQKAYEKQKAEREKSAYEQRKKEQNEALHKTYQLLLSDVL